MGWDTSLVVFAILLSLKHAEVVLALSLLLLSQDLSGCLLCFFLLGLGGILATLGILDFLEKLLYVWLILPFCSVSNSSVLNSNTKTREYVISESVR